MRAPPPPPPRRDPSLLGPESLFDKEGGVHPWRCVIGHGVVGQKAAQRPLPRGLCICHKDWKSVPLGFCGCTYMFASWMGGSGAHPLGGGEGCVCVCVCVCVCEKPQEVGSLAGGSWKKGFVGRPPRAFKPLDVRDRRVRVVAEGRSGQRPSTSGRRASVQLGAPGDLWRNHPLPRTTSSPNPAMTGEPPPPPPELFGFVDPTLDLGHSDTLHGVLSG